MTIIEKTIGVLLFIILIGGTVFYLREIKISSDLNRQAVEKIILRDSLNSSAFKAKDTIDKKNQSSEQAKTIRFKKETKILKNEMDTISFDPALLPNY